MTGSTEPFADGNIITAAGQNSAHWRLYTEQGINHIRQLMNRAGVYSAGSIGGWGEAYTSAGGRNGSVDTDLDKTTCEFSSNKYIATSEPYIIIEATSLTTGDFAINNCTATLFSAGVWILRCSTGTINVKKSQLIKTLFYGSNGTDARITTTYVTGISALKTNITEFVGLYGWYARSSSGGAGSSTGTTIYTGTFTDTSTNTSVYSWSYCAAPALSSDYTRWELPSATILNTAGPNSSSDEIGTDTFSDVKSNPSTGVQRTSDNDGGDNASTQTIILTKGSLSWALTGSSGGKTANNIDFNVDESVPAFTLDDNISSDLIITHDIPAGTFSDTVSSAIGVPFIEDWETGADIQYKLTGTAGAEDTGWLDAMDTNPEVSNFTAFTAEPDTLIVKLIPKTTSPTTGYPSVRGFYINSWSD